MSFKNVLPKRLFPKMPSSPRKIREDQTKTQKTDGDDYEPEEFYSSPTYKQTNKSDPLPMQRRLNIQSSPYGGEFSISRPSTSENVELAQWDSFQMGE